MVQLPETRWSKQTLISPTPYLSTSLSTPTQGLLLRRSGLRRGQQRVIGGEVGPRFYHTGPSPLAPRLSFYPTLQTYNLLVAR